jgi:hypothetical protein
MRCDWCAGAGRVRVCAYAGRAQVSVCAGPAPRALAPQLTRTTGITQACLSSYSSFYPHATTYLASSYQTLDLRRGRGEGGEGGGGIEGGGWGEEGSAAVTPAAHQAQHAHILQQAQQAHILLGYYYICVLILVI